MHVFKILEIIGPITDEQKDNLLKKFDGKMRLVNKDFKVPYGAYFYEGNTKNLIDMHMLLLGGYELGLLNLIAKKVNLAGSIVLDIGANTGSHTMFFATRAKHVYAFEPYAPVRKKLKQHLTLNKIENVTVQDFGLYKKEAELLFYPPSEENLGTGSFYEKADKKNLFNPLKLSVRQGSQVIKELKLKNISLIKIDVEGLEYEVLLGLMDYLKSASPLPTLLFEYTHLSNYLFDPKNELMQFLTKQYKLSVIRDPNSHNAYEIPWERNQFGNVLAIPI